VEKFRIRGGNAIKGRVSISGAKNSALPCMAAAILTAEHVILHNIPYVRDIITMRRLLEDIGAHVLTPELRTHKISAANIEVMTAPYELVKTMRASVLALGPLLARFGKARVSLPGGCAIGARPIDLHLAGFTKMGAEVYLEAGDVVARAPDDGLVGAEFDFEKISVTGTENLMMAGTLARGRTTINNAAREPEVRDLAELLNKMGARVRGAGTPRIEIDGVEALGGAEHTIIPDRIETGTFIVAGAITRGELEIKDCNPEHCNRIIAKLREVGVEIEEVNQSTLHVSAGKKLKAAELTTQLSARELLDALLAIERAHGRHRDGTRWGPRALDLDILLIGDQRIDEPHLHVPHPYIAERAFVLLPLADIDAQLLVPGHGRVGELLENVDTEGCVALDAP